VNEGRGLNGGTKTRDPRSCRSVKSRGARVARGREDEVEVEQCA